MLESGHTFPMNLTVVEAKPFVPASDFERAKEFYLAVGFEIPWSSEGLAYVRFGQTLTRRC